MKILMFGWEYPPHISGGLGTACYGLTKAMTKSGDAIKFVVPRAENTMVNENLQLINASDVSLPKGWKPDQFKILNKLIPNLEQKLHYLSNFETFEFSGAYGPNLTEEVNWYTLVAAELAQLHSFDVIHAHDWLTYAAGIAAKEISGKPLVVHVHATEFDRSSTINPDVFEVERLGMQAADKVIAVSNLTRNNIINKYNISAHKVLTAYNGVVPKKKTKSIEKAKKSRRKTVTFLGRITYQKGPKYFIEAAAKVLGKDKNVRFVMAGSGDMLSAMVEEVAKHHLTPYFHFTGFLNKNDVDRMYAMSDVYVMPSVSEPFGIAPLEAIQHDVPVIVSKQSGVSEVLPAALKVDFWDTDELANSIYGLIQYNSLAKSVRNLSKTVLSKLTWEKTAQQVQSAYLTIT